MPQNYRKFKAIMVESRFTPIVFALIAITLRLVMFYYIGIEQQQHPTSFVWHLIAPLVSNDWISLSASTVSILIIAYTITQLNLSFNLIRFRTALPFSMLVLLLSTHPMFLPMSPNYLSAILILFTFFPLLQSYQHHAPRHFAFKSGVLIAMAATFQVYSLMFLPIWLYGETSMHGFRMRSFIALLLGAILVLWNVASFYFIFDSLNSFIEPFTHFTNIIESIPVFSLTQWISIGLFIFLSVVFLVLDYKTFRRERVLTQKALSFIILIVVCSFILHFLYLGQTDTFMCFIVIMMSFIIAHYYSHVKKTWQVYSFVFLVIGILLFYINFLVGNPLQLFT